MSAKLQFLGATDNEITGSRTLFTLPDGMKVLIDFGLTQTNDSGKFEQNLNWNGREFEFDVKEISYICLTHQNIDHIGLLSLLVSRGFEGKIITTAPVGDFAALALRDGYKIMVGEIERINRNRPKNKLKPLFTEQDVEETIHRIQCYNFNTPIILSDTCTLYLEEAGHLLGACMPMFEYKDGRKTKKTIFTGDISGLSNKKPFIKPTAELGDVDHCVIESTYGSRQHSKTDPLKILEDTIRETCIENKNVLIIPAFAMGRSSEILWLLREVYIKNKEFYKIPIYIDSPMSVKSQRIMDANRDFWDDIWLERDKELGNLFEWDVIQYITDYKDSELNLNKFPKIVISSSGMASNGRILSYLAYHLSDRKCTVLFSGYVAEGTLGHKILNAEHKTIAINRHRVTMRANVKQLNFSSHADVNGLLDVLKTSKRGKLKTVFLNHGSEEAKENLKEEVKRHLKIDAIIPKYKEEFILN